MASPALRRWRAERLPRIDALLGTRADVSRARPRRRAALAQLDAALVVALAAEFQAFARELHDAAAAFFSETVADGNGSLAELLLDALTRRRQLGAGNAHPGSLGADFGRLGVELWPCLAAIEARTNRHNRDLTALNVARNAVAHGDPAPLPSLSSAGYPLTLRTVRRWRSTVDALARTMDVVTCEELAALLGVRPPWEEEVR